MTWLRTLLTCCSYACFRVVRFLFQSLVHFKLSRERQQTKQPQWSRFSDLITDKPLFFHYLMVTGPRWNCHAAIGVLRNLEVKGPLTIVKPAPDSCASWTMVVYSQSRGTKTMAHIGPGDFEGLECTLDLEPGIYSMGARYYQPTDKAAWPTLRQANHEIVGSPLDGENQKYQSTLQSFSQKPRGFYRLLHYHAYKMGCGESPFSSEFVRNTLLPVGNPATTFMFGGVRAGEQIHIQIDKDFAAANLIYLTVLDTASLPLFWDHVTELDYGSPAMKAPGIYLIRLHGINGNPPAAQVKVSTSTGR